MNLMLAPNGALKSFGSKVLNQNTCKINAGKYLNLRGTVSGFKSTRCADCIVGISYGFHSPTNDTVIMTVQNNIAISLED